jgi:hypothetical protein
MLNSLNLSSSTLEALQSPRASKLGIILATLEGKSRSELPERYINQTLPARVVQNHADGTTDLALDLPDLPTQTASPLIVQARLSQRLAAGSEINLVFGASTDTPTTGVSDALASQTAGGASNASASSVCVRP